MVSRWISWIGATVILLVVGAVVVSAAPWTRASFGAATRTFASAPEILRIVDAFSFDGVSLARVGRIAPVPGAAQLELALFPDMVDRIPTDAVPYVISSTVGALWRLQTADAKARVQRAISALAGSVQQALLDLLAHPRFRSYYLPRIRSLLADLTPSADGENQSIDGFLNALGRNLVRHIEPVLRARADAIKAEILSSYSAELTDVAGSLMLGGEPDLSRLSPVLQVFLLQPGMREALLDAVTDTLGSDAGFDGIAGLIRAGDALSSKDWKVLLGALLADPTLADVWSPVETQVAATGREIFRAVFTTGDGRRLDPIAGVALKRLIFGQEGPLVLLADPDQRRILDAAGFSPLASVTPTE